MEWLHKLRRRPPLRDRIEEIIYRLNTQLEQLKQTFAKIQHRDKEIFDKCIASVMGKDQERAAMYANECAEVRKIARILLRSEIALERVNLRLQTVGELGDILVQMAPAIGVVRAVKGELAGVVPEVSHELSMIDETLGSIVLEAGEATGFTIPIGASSEEAQKILNEANSVSEQRMKERFPELPTIVPPLPESPAKGGK